MTHVSNPWQYVFSVPDFIQSSLSPAVMNCKASSAGWIHEINAKSNAFQNEALE